jgi:hypothetical protein
MSARAAPPDNRGIETSPPKPIRVVVSELSGMLRDIVTETLEAAPDIAVTVVLPPNSIVATVDAIEADVAVLAGGPEGLPALGRELLGRHPWMHVMAVRRDGRDASLYELRPFECKLGEMSPETLLDAVRRAGATRS